MGIADSNGRTREGEARRALEDGVLSGLRARFQTRIYRLGSQLTRVDGAQGAGRKVDQGVEQIRPIETATHIDDGLKQLVADTADLPVGAVVLLSDGGNNTGGLAGPGIGVDSLQALRNRRLPVHTIGFGKEAPGHDVEIEGVSIAATAPPNARIGATVSLAQSGYSGKQTTLTVRDGDKTLAAREVTLGGDGGIQTEQLFFPLALPALKVSCSAWNRLQAKKTSPTTR